jgi:hypothetical protein
MEKRWYSEGTLYCLASYHAPRLGIRLLLAQVPVPVLIATLGVIPRDCSRASLLSVRSAGPVGSVYPNSSF